MVYAVHITVMRKTI